MRWGRGMFLLALAIAAAHSGRADLGSAVFGMGHPPAKGDGERPIFNPSFFNLYNLGDGKLSLT
jgi:hypothetical protein